MCQINNSMLIKTICYLCGYDNFSIEDVCNAQPKAVVDDIYNWISYAVCPYCGFTIEI